MGGGLGGWLKIYLPTSLPENEEIRGGVGWFKIYLHHLIKKK